MIYSPSSSDSNASHYHIYLLKLSIYLLVLSTQLQKSQNINLCLEEHKFICQYNLILIIAVSLPVLKSQSLVLYVIFHPPCRGHHEVQYSDAGLSWAVFRSTSIIGLESSLSPNYQGTVLNMRFLPPAPTTGCLVIRMIFTRIILPVHFFS